MRASICVKEQAPVPASEKHDGRYQRDRHIAQQAVGRHRRNVGPQHACNHHRGHRHGCQHTDHRTLRHDRIERQQREIKRRAHHDLKQQQPHVQHRRLHLAGFHPAKGDEEHQKDQRGRNHLVRPRFERRHRTAQQGARHHGRGHGDRLDIAVQIFQYVHLFHPFTGTVTRVPSLRSTVIWGLSPRISPGLRRRDRPATHPPFREIRSGRPEPPYPQASRPRPAPRPAVLRPARR